MIGPCISIFHDEIPWIKDKLQEIPDDIAIEIRLDKQNPNNKLHIPSQILKDRIIILTVRTVEEGGYFHGDPRELHKMYSIAIDSDPDYIDIGVYNSICRSIVNMAIEKGVKTIVSYHNRYWTEPYNELIGIYRDIESLDPNIIKIVTYATKTRDNYEIIKLHLWRDRDKPLTAFCMGRYGRISRIYNLLLKGAITYLTLKDVGTAEGQMRLGEYLWLKEVYRYV